jgi:hypothetical protein
MNKLDMTLIELIKELPIAETVMGPQSKILVTKSSSSRTRLKPRKFNNKKKANAAAQPKSQFDAKPKGKCFKYSKKGHWKNVHYDGWIIIYLDC